MAKNKKQNVVRDEDLNSLAGHTVTGVKREDGQIILIIDGKKVVVVAIE